MRSTQRNTLALIAILAVTTVVVGLIWQIHSSRNSAETATVYAGYLAAVAIGITLLMAVGGWWQKSRVGAAVQVSTPVQVAAAADRLAEVMTSRWRLEAAGRRIVTPAPATVRWHWAADEVTALRLEVTTAPAPGTGPPPLPDLGRPGELLNSGVVTRLHDEVYARLPHGRLVMLGGPGAGKTGAMILLLLAALDRRAALAGDQRDRVPVPVWLTLGGWDPATTSLQDWAAATMNRDFPALRAADYGPDAARELLRDSRVALFLDGLDEMPGRARAQALKRVGDEVRGLRVVITSRPEEYRHALRGGQPDNTAVIELRPVRPGAAAAYLLHGQAGRIRHGWEQVGAYLTRNPDSAAAQALDNPLNLSLSRDAYTSRDPAELTDSSRFPTAEAIREYLIEQFLITAYPDERQRVHAIWWLAWIAHHMGTSRDLAWWGIPVWTPRWQLRLTRGATFGLLAGLAFGLWSGIVYWAGTAEQWVGGLATWLLPALATGLGVGLGAGLWTGLATGPQALLPRRRRWLAFGFAYGLLFGPIAGLTFGLYYVQPPEPQNGLKVGLVVGLVIGLVFGLAGIARTLVPQWKLRLARGLVAGIVAGLLGTLFTTPIIGLIFALDLGFAYGLSGGLVFGLPGVPQTLVRRMPRRRELGRIIAVGLLFFPLLSLVLLNLWATPIADSPSATAVGTYYADRRASVIYGLVFGLASGLFFGFLGWFMFLVQGGTGFGGLFVGLASGLGFGLCVGFAAAYAAGQVPQAKLNELILAVPRPRRGRTHFQHLLEDALGRQVLRQAGTVYQFRHAAIQAYLAAQYPILRNSPRSHIAALPAEAGTSSTDSDGETRPDRQAGIGHKSP